MCEKCKEMNANITHCIKHCFSSYFVTDVEPKAFGYLVMILL